MKEFICEIDEGEPETVPMDRKALPVVFEFANLYGALVTLVNLLNPYRQYDEEEKKDFELYNSKK